MDTGQTTKLTLVGDISPIYYFLIFPIKQKLSHPAYYIYITLGCRRPIFKVTNKIGPAKIK